MLRSRSALFASLALALVAVAFWLLNSSPPELPGTDLERDTAAPEVSRKPGQAPLALDQTSDRAEQVPASDLEATASERVVFKAAKPARKQPKLQMKGRLVNQYGEALFGADLTIKLQVTGNPIPCSLNLLVESDGRWSTSLDWALGILVGQSSTGASLADGVQIEMDFAATDESPGWTQRLARSVQASDFPLDLGDVVMTPKPLLLAGRVFEGSGVPVQGAVVWLLTLTPLKPDRDKRMATMVKMRDRSTLDSARRSHLRGLPGNSSKPTDVHGSFRIGGEAEDKRYFAAVQVGDEFIGDSIPVEVGGNPVDLILKGLGQVGSILGSVQISEGFDWIDLRASIRSVEKPDDSRTFTARSLKGSLREVLEMTTSVDASGNFGYLDLMPGFYDLSLLVGDQVLDWPRIEVVPDQETRDERMQNVDLTGLLDVIDLAVRNEAGELLRLAKFKISRADGSSIEQHTLTGKAKFLSVYGNPLSISAAGYKTIETKTSSLVDVRLEIGPSITLLLPKGLVVPDGYRVTARLSRKSPRGSGDVVFYETRVAGLDHRRTFGAAGARLPVPALGELRVELYVGKLAHAHGFGQRVPPWGPGSVLDLAQGDLGASFILDIDPAKLTVMMP